MNTRRDFLKKMSGMGLGLLAAAGVGNSLSCSKPGPTVTLEKTTLVTVTAAPATAFVSFPWPYQKLDPLKAADKAYSNFARGRCMYAVFESIIGMLRDEYGAPYKSFPTAMMKYGAVGIADWGTVCGALNGAAAAISLFIDADPAEEIINELFYWHSLTALPDYKPSSTKFASIPASVAGSPLCHQSITGWSKLSGFTTNSQERVERCVRLSASVTRKAVELLNQKTDGIFKAAYKVPDGVTACLVCHGPGSVQGDVHTTSETNCLRCHEVLDPATHPAAK
jgi:hypothetical protein